MKTDANSTRRISQALLKIAIVAGGALVPIAVASAVPAPAFAQSASQDSDSQPGGEAGGMLNRVQLPPQDHSAPTGADRNVNGSYNGNRSQNGDYNGN